MDFLSKHSSKIWTVFILCIAFISMSIFVFIQPFGDGPDEINRYKVVSYIEEYGHIPVGDAPEIIIDGYGASYAFQPILTYIIDGYMLRLLTPLSLSFETKLILSRYVNVIFGLIAAYFTVKLSGLLFEDRLMAQLFSIAVILLPQNIFIYTYVNTDGMGLMSVIIMLFGLILGYRTDFDKKSCISICCGIILCLMSYYNCYGYILMVFFAFIAYFIHKKDIKAMFAKGMPIALGVLLLAGWWFIRNAILYGGDIFALNARRECAAATGNILWLENMANTYLSQGYSLREMVFETDYYTLVWKSFIAMFGPMAIPTHHYVYMAYKYLAIICIIGLFIPIKSSGLPQLKNIHRIFIWITLISGMIIPAVMALYYSYTWDFQPQGRYYLPCLIPFAFLLATGLEKLINLLPILVSRITKSKKTLELSKVFLYHIVYVFFLSTLAISVYEMLKYYASTL